MNRCGVAETYRGARGGELSEGQACRQVRGGTGVRGRMQGHVGRHACMAMMVMLLLLLLLMN